MFQAFCVQQAERCITEMRRKKGAGCADSVPTDLKKLPKLTANSFIVFFKNGPGGDVKGSVIFVYNEDIQIHSLYTTDRSKTTQSQ